jgi:hypothetical protein
LTPEATPAWRASAAANTVEAAAVEVDLDRENLDLVEGVECFAWIIRIIHSLGMVPKLSACV